MEAITNPETTESGYSYQWYQKSGSSYVAISGATERTYTTSTEQTTTYKVEVWTNAGSSKVSSKDFIVNIDTTVPTCSFSGTSKSWTKSDRVITATCKDDASRCTSDTASKKWIFNTTTKTANVSYIIKDNAGNVATCSGTVNVYVDKTSPSASISAKSNNSSYSSDSWTYYNVILTATPTGSPSGYKSYQWYTVSGSTYTAISGATGQTSDYSSKLTVKIDKCTNTTTSYSSWGTCTKTCGTGIQSRTVTKTGISGKTCSTETQTKNCNTQECPKVCGWSMSATKTLSGNTATLNLVFSNSSDSQNCSLTGVSRISVTSSSSYLCYAPNSGSFSDYTGAVTGLKGGIATAACKLSISFGSVTSSIVCMYVLSIKELLVMVLQNK